jgi:carboxypeptidase C (cathepsin A)
VTTEDSPAPGTPGPGTDQPREGDAPDRDRPAPTDDLVTTAHRLRAGDRDLDYTATAGRIVLRQEVHEDGVFKGHREKAEVFLTAYVLDGADPATRPVVFAFNGGPGSSSVWLHLGLLGPRRVLMGDAGDLRPPPYALADNAETLLAVADLVFIDPVSTGYSRAVREGKPADFHGFTGDLEAVGEVIRLWTTRNGRWMSPKLLAGESYGTLRAAALAEHLQTRYGLYPNGLVLLSMVLDLATIRFTEGNELPYGLFLPTYAAIAHHHGRHPGRSLEEVVAEAVEYAERDYPWALARGHRLTGDERRHHVETVARLTGLSTGYVDRVDLRVEHLRFFTELLREEGRTVGRLDGRFTGWEPDGASEHISSDPAHLAITGPYAAALNHYVRTELEYASDLPYEVLTARVHPWSYAEFEGRGVSVADRLAAAMRANPHLRVHVACGYHDGATPFTAAEHTIAHLRIPPELRGNIETAYYPAGHMMYVHEESRLQQSRDVAAFVRAATGG